MHNSMFFNTIDTPQKAYILGLIVHNIESIQHNIESIQHNIRFIDSRAIHRSALALNKQLVNHPLFSTICELFDDNMPFSITSDLIIDDIMKHINNGRWIESINVSNDYFIANNSKENVTQFLTAYFESKSNTSMTVKNETLCTLSCHSQSNIDSFVAHFNIPTYCCKSSSVQYKGTNFIDLLGLMYDDYTSIFNKPFVEKIVQKLSLDVPKLYFHRMNENAIVPTKANYSDVGYDLSAIGIHKQINSKTILCNTGIKLEIPASYYVEIVPRSSIVKSGYILANSIGIIDASYKGELFIALIKIDDASPDITFPFRCCQLIMKKQIFPKMIEDDDITTSKRGDGGFGSSG